MKKKVSLATIYRNMLMIQNEFLKMKAAGVFSNLPLLENYIFGVTNCFSTAGLDLELYINKMSVKPINAKIYKQKRELFSQLSNAPDSAKRLFLACSLELGELFRIKNPIYYRYNNLKKIVLAHFLLFLFHLIDNLAKFINLSFRLIRLSSDIVEKFKIKSNVMRKGVDIVTDDKFYLAY